MLEFKVHHFAACAPNSLPKTLSTQYQTPMIQNDEEGSIIDFKLVLLLLVLRLLKLKTQLAYQYHHGSYSYWYLVVRCAYQRLKKISKQKARQNKLPQIKIPTYHTFTDDILYIQSQMFYWFKFWLYGSTVLCKNSSLQNIADFITQSVVEIKTPRYLYDPALTTIDEQIICVVYSAYITHNFKKGSSSLSSTSLVFLFWNNIISSVEEVGFHHFGWTYYIPSLFYGQRINILVLLL